MGTSSPTLAASEHTRTHFDALALELTSVALWVFDLDRMTICWANRAALALWKARDLDALRSRDFSSPPPQVKGRLDQYRARFACGEEVVESWTFTPDGEPATVVCTLRGVALPAGGQGMLVEARPACTEQLPPLELRGVEALRRTSVMITLFGADGRVLMQNPAASRAFGDALAGSNTFVERFLDPALGEQLLSQLGAGESFCGDVEVRSTQGTRWHRLEARRTADPMTGELAIVVDQRDATESKLSEQALHASERRFRLLCMQAPIGIFQNDAVGSCVFVNRRLCELARLSEAEMLGEAWWHVLHPEDAAQAGQALEALGEGAAEASFQCRIRGQGGSECWVLVSVVPLRDAEGKLIGSLGAVSDVTDRLHAEQEIVRSREAALEASRVKSQFLANMSHEIRTPMNGILGMLQIALETELTSEQREYLSACHASAEGLLEIINDILDLSKIEAGKIELETLRISMDELLRRSLQSSSVKAHAKDLELVVQVAPDVPQRMYGDPVRVGQVLTNLLGNAVKFTESGYIRLRVSRIVEGSGAPFLQFAVEDTGVGIPLDRQSHIFEAFSQADGSTTRRFGGTGLGLAICRELATRMGGKLWVESEPGRGSTFFFMLPLRAAVLSQPVRGMGSSSGGLRTLVVEDHPLARAALIEMFTQLGADVRSADGPMQALAVAQSEVLPFDSVLIDQGLGSEQGLELPRALMRIRSCRSSRFVLLRSRERISRRVLEQAGFEFALDKPVLPSDLTKALTAPLVQSPATSRFSVLAEPALAPESARMRVLIVEDHPINARFLTSLLQRRGHVVAHASNGARGLALFGSQVFDIVLMDVQMPEMDGLEATRRIRALESATGRRVPIIALTANAMKGDAEQCLAAGMDHYLSKPIDARQLYEAIARFGRRADPPRPEVVLPLVSAPPSYDLEELLQRAAGDPQFMADLLRIFSETHEEMLREISESVERGDSEAVRGTAHRLKGALQLICAEPAARIAKELELAGRRGQHAEFSRLYRDLEREMERLRTDLSARP